MTKKIALAMNLVILVLAMIWLVWIRGEDKAFFPTVSSSKIEKINKNFTRTEEDILEVLCYNGEELPFDAKEGVFYLPLAMDEAWEEGTISSGDKGVTVLFDTDYTQADKQEIISSGEKLPFYACKNETYRIYYLVLTGLPVMEITTVKGPETEEGEGLYYTTLYDSATKENWITQSELFMHVRGNTSKTYPKKGYKMQLVKKNAKGEYTANPQKLLDMRKDDDWILYALYNDGTKIRDKFCIDIWNSYGASANEFGGKLGTELSYIEIIWDGAYYGLYGLMEPIDKKQVNLQEEDGVHLTEYMYKKKFPSALDVSSFDMEDPDLIREGFEIKGGRESADASDWQPLKNMLVWQQSEEAYFTEHASEYVDMNNVIDMWIFTNMITGYDQLAKNMYYIAKAEKGQYKFYFAPWDMDLTWGYTSDPNYPLSTKFEDFLTENYIWWEPGNRMMETNAQDAVSMARERYQELRKTVLTDEWLNEKLLELEHTVIDSGAMRRDEIRWPEGNHDRSYEELKTYMEKRMIWMDSFMQDIEQGLQE